MQEQTPNVPALSNIQYKTAFNLVYGEVHNPRRMCCTYIRPYMGITFDTTHLESTQGH